MNTIDTPNTEKIKLALKDIYHKGEEFKRMNLKLRMLQSEMSEVFYFLVEKLGLDIKEITDDDE